jgi:PEP-CTERM motif
MTNHVLRATLLLLVTTYAVPAYAQTQTVADPVGDFLPTYTGPQSPSLDVTSFTVAYNAVASAFLISTTLAGDVSGAPGSYIIGVNTGTGVNAPFSTVGQANVRFNQTITIQPNGTGTIGATPLLPGSIFINGTSFSALIPLALLPSTGFAPQFYGFNVWPRSGTGLGALADFAPNNATLAASSVPEPASWAFLLLGFAGIGLALRRRRQRTLRHASL